MIDIAEHYDKFEETGNEKNRHFTSTDGWKELHFSFIIYADHVTYRVLSHFILTKIE